MRYTFGQTKEKVDERPNTKTETKGSGTVFTGADLDRAIYEMTSVKAGKNLKEFGLNTRPCKIITSLEI